MFKDRTEAGHFLASKLEDYSKNKEVIVVTIPRGGLPIGYIIAKQLDVPLEIVLSKKIGHPSHKEFAIGAVTLKNCILSDNTNDISKDYITVETTRIRNLLKRRQTLYYGVNEPIKLHDKIVIVVDDGVATGNTLISSIQLIAQQKPSEIIVALPVAPIDTLKKIEDLPMVDEVICLLKPNYFHSVSQFYKEFKQLDDDDVVEFLKAANKNS